MEFNPWKVLSLEAFHYYCCPECEDRYKTKDQFIDHAFGEHPKALDTIPGIVDTKVPIPNKLPEPSKPKQELEEDNESNGSIHDHQSDCEQSDFLQYSVRSEFLKMLFLQVAQLFFQLL